MGILIGSGGGKDPADLDAKLKRRLLALVTIALAAAAVYAVKALWPVVEWVFRVLAPFMIALVLAYISNPLVDFAQRKLKLGRVGGLTVVAAFLAVAAIGLLTLAVALLLQVQEVLGELSKNLPDRIAAWTASLPGLDVKVSRDEIAKFLTEAGKRFGGLAATLLPKMGEGTLSVAQGIASGIGAVFSFFSLMMFVALITFYFLIDFHHIPAVVRVVVPKDRETRFFGLARKVDVAMGGYLRGQLLDCVCVAVLSTALMFLVGPAKWAVLIGCVAGAVNFVPYLGPVIGGTPAVLWALFHYQTWGERSFHALLVIGAFALVQAVDGIFLQPNIVGKHSRLHPLVVLLALLVGARFGIGGMIVAVPVACMARVLIKELWWDTLAERDRSAHQE